MEYPEFDLDTDTDLDADDLFAPANDNRHPSSRERRVPRYVTDGRPDMLLALAGFDPEKIPPRLRIGALRVAWCNSHGLHTLRAVGSACGLTRKKLAHTLTAMHAAEKGRAA
jgi:hypothetical protein